MSGSIKIPLICPVLVDRGRELALLDRLLATSADSQGQVVLVSGEAGIGKSRLITEIGTRTAAQGRVVLRGRCFEADRGLPFAPLADLLRNLLAGQPHAAQIACLGDAAPVLATLLPELASHFPAEAETQPADPEQTQRRLFSFLATWLFSRGPALVVLEDLHWADDGTLAFLNWLARYVPGHQLLVILSYRSDEGGEDWRSLLPSLERMRPALTEIPLRRLDQDGVQGMITAIFAQPRPVRHEFSVLLYSLTDGNPFFVEETLKTLVATGEIYQDRGVWTRKPLATLQPPPTVAEAVQARARTLDAGERRLLELAAVLGRDVAADLLREIAQLDEETFVRQLKVLIRAQLLVEESADQISFRHALARQAIYVGLLARERRTLHRQCGEIIERFATSRGVDRTADLAHHYYTGGVWDLALHYSRLAGDRAREAFAWAAASEFYTRAIEATGQLGKPERADLYLARGRAHDLPGNFSAASADYARALALAEAGDDTRIAWECLLALGFLWTGRDFARGHAYLDRALVVARTLGDPAILAHSLNRVGNCYANLDQHDDAVRLHREALALCEQIGDLQGQATSLDLLGTAHMLVGATRASARYHARAIALFRAVDDLPGLVSCQMIHAMRAPHYFNRTSASMPVPSAVLDGEVAETLRLAGALGSPRREAEIRVYFAFVYGSLGRFPEALTYARQALALADELAIPMWQLLAHIALGAIAHDLLAYEDARRHFVAAWEYTGELHSLVHLLTLAGFLVPTLIATGETGRAAALLAEYPQPTGALPRSVMRRNLLAGEAELALAAGQPATALLAIDQMIAALPAAESGPVPYLTRLRGEALLGLGRLAEAEAILREGLAASEAVGTLPESWRLHLALGKLQRRRRRFAAAEECCVAAQALVDRLVVDLGEEPWGLSLAGRARELIPTFAPTERRVAKRAAQGLTERERSVAALIAQGRSNAEIAATLVLSRRTIEVHVSNIMGKLGVSARTQIAAWVVANRLTSPEIT